MNGRRRCEVRREVDIEAKLLVDGDRPLVKDSGIGAEGSAVSRVRVVIGRVGVITMKSTASSSVQGSRCELEMVGALDCARPL